MQRLQRLPASESPPWQDLRDTFLRALPGNGAQPPEAGLMTWRLLVTHPWFLAQLTSCAERVLKRSGAPIEWQVDIEQHVILLLAQKLQQKPDLGVDPSLAERHFTGWLGTIITRDCRQALRRLQRLHRPSAELVEQCTAIDDRAWREIRVDLNLAIAQMDALDRIVMTSWLKGHSIQQISVQLKRSYGRTYRSFTRGMKTLRRMLQ